ncbi:MAG: DUF58 domain-containing protein [Kiritimatiellae bacterium]|nr:DUF58 domain-containing protein [Kiritimatiellia bacterium]
MTGISSLARRIWHRLRNPPIGYQHGRRGRFTRNFPLISWIYYAVTAYTTPRLLILGLIGIGPTLLLMLVGFESRILMLGFSLVGWIMVCAAAGLIWRPKLEVTAAMPVRVECGSRFETRYKVRNTGRFCARDLAIDSLVYSDWLSMRRGRAYLNVLPSGTAETVSATGHALARGVYTLPALRYDSSFPCGFWRWGRTAPHERLISVYPRYTRLEAFDIPLGNRNKQDLSTARDMAREALEFHGCREFREGDALRHVHPRSSARLGVPVVKEFQSEGRSRTAILIDTRESATFARMGTLRRRENPVEAALSLAAAATDALSSTDRVLELLVAGPQVYRFVTAGRVGYLEEVLDLLAAVESCRDDPLDRLEPLLFDEIRALQSVLLILTGWDQRRAELVQSISAWETGLKVVLITPKLNPVAGLPHDVIRLTARTILRGEVLTL